MPASTMQSLLQLQKVILEMIAIGETLERTATRLCVEVEKLVPEVICSILTVDPSGMLRPLAAPTLCPAFSAALDGVPIGPNPGSCGAAAYLRTDVAVIDIDSEENWAEFKHLALPLGLRASWSSPILNANGSAIGTFALYYRTCRGPTDFEREIVGHCVHLCVIAIERHQRVIERERRGFFDALTELPNRAAFNVALAKLSCDIPGAWAMFVIDLDNLKEVNDTFGHQAGDLLLQTASKRMTDALAPDRIFRIGGDEFAVILESSEALRDIHQAAERILNNLMTSADCDGNMIVPRATIGGAILSSGDSVAERVRQHADFALYHAKETGRGGFVRFWPGLGTNIMRRLAAIRDVAVALREDRIEAHYQPIVRLDTREIVGLEALCRMRIGPQIIPAASFHEATTDKHVSTELTARMMSLVAADVRAWLDLGIPFQHVGINVSSCDIHGNVDQVLEAAFRAHAVPLKHVILEVTESVYMGHGDRLVQQAVQALRAKGLRVALDDFGTGFASLTHLMTVPVDIIKIDKSFVDRLAHGDASVAIIEGLIHIARKLDIGIVAEGIETEEQAQRLASMGCTLGQGYLFSRAANYGTMTDLLIDNGRIERGAWRIIHPNHH